MLRILQAARLDRSHSAAWSKFVALIARALAVTIDPDIADEEERFTLAVRHLHDALTVPPPRRR
ncbi:MAG: hypothetical protein U1E65_22055 [Myxococcota bacterium]